jgi:hypothetical protein
MKKVFTFLRCFIIQYTGGYYSYVCIYMCVCVCFIYNDIVLYMVIMSETYISKYILYLTL